MKEIYHQTPMHVPVYKCDYCGERTTTQAYSLMQARSKITREWFFCKLECLRSWSAPVRTDART